MAAEAVFQGRRMPADSREALGRNLQGTLDETARVGAKFPAACKHIAELRACDGLAGEAARVRGVVARFASDQQPLTDAAAARMLAAIQEPGPRDAAWAAMSQNDAPAHAALWRDLTRRAPEEARTPAAALLAFSAWLAGDGAEANLALDLIPASSDYNLARFTDALVQAAVPPSAWETVMATSDNGSASALLQQAHLSQPPPPRSARAAGTLDRGRDHPATPDR